MAISLVTHGQALGASGGTTSSLNTSGATLLVAVCTYLTSATISDNKGNTWTGLTAKSDSSITSQIFYVNSGAPTVGSGHTFTISGAVSVINILAFSGTNPSPLFDVQNGNSAATGTTISPGIVTPSFDGEVIISGVTGGNTMTTVTIDSGFTITDQAPLTGGSNYGSGAAYLIQTSAASVNPTWTFNNGSTSSISSTIATFLKSTAVANPNFLLMF